MRDRVGHRGRVRHRGRVKQQVIQNLMEYLHLHEGIGHVTLDGLSGERGL